MDLRSRLGSALKTSGLNGASDSELERILCWCEKNHTQILFPDRFPPFLKNIPLAPKLLFVRGSLDVLSMPLLGVVGGRKASSYGLACAFKFSRELAALGFGVVSGLAKGIDGAAHQGALISQGKTVAILGSGFAHLYPREHRRLANQILEKGGTWLSEYPPFTPPLAHHFPHRNRLISGISWGTLVVEAGKKSGSLITALSSINQGREVFVVPGPIQGENFLGSHELIQQGAKLVIGVKDILMELPLLMDAAGRELDGEPIPMNFAESFTFADWMENPQRAGSFDLQELISRGDVMELAPQRYLSIKGL